MCPSRTRRILSLNGAGEKQVPWGLEQTPLPASGSAAGVSVLPSGTPLHLTGMVQLGRALGIEGRMRVTVPDGETGVWTISQNSMSYDGASPTLDRTVHVESIHRQGSGRRALCRLRRGGKGDGGRHCAA